MSEGEFQAEVSVDEDYFKERTGLSLREQYIEHHPQVLSGFEEDMEWVWGRKWKANTNVGKLRVVLLHRPGREFLSVGKPTPWPPHGTGLPEWRVSEKMSLEELQLHHQNLVDAYRAEGVEVVIRKPEAHDPPYQVKAVYTDDVCHPAVYGQVILRMYDHMRRGEELYTYQTLAELGCPVVGMIQDRGMTEGGSIGWLDEKHLLIAVHFPRANTREPGVMRGNESGHRQFASIVKLQDPEVDVRLCPGYGTSLGTSHYSLIDRHVSVQDPRTVDPYLRDWTVAEMGWEYVDPPSEVCVKVHTGNTLMPVVKRAPNTGVVLEPRKILVPAGNPKATKWFEGLGVEVVEVEVGTLVRPRNSGSIKCTCGGIMRDSEPKGY